VPWEIGVATEKERYLSSYIYGEVDVPEYLGKWPYLRNRNDLDIYINECRKTDRLFESRIRGGAGVRPYTSDFRAFHESLKSSLGQR
jgi:hypothetical protein